MLRLAEIGLFLLPTALYVTWLYLGAHTPRWLVWWTVAATLALAGATVWFGMENAIPPDERYEPARIENGEIVPGHGVSRKPRW